MHAYCQKWSKLYTSEPKKLLNENIAVLMVGYKKNLAGWATRLINTLLISSSLGTLLSAILVISVIQIDSSC